MRILGFALVLAALPQLAACSDECDTPVRCPPAPDGCTVEGRSCGSCGTIVCPDGGGDAATDSGGGDTTVADTGVYDAGSCMMADPDPCAAGTTCECCPAGGPATACFCTVVCTGDGDCPAELPTCSLRPGGADGLCVGGTAFCAWESVCASPDTPIATPEGDRRIADLDEGDLVYSVRDEQTVAVPVLRTGRVSVTAHRVVRLELEGGAVLEMSAGHPTADGRPFGALSAGDLFDGVRILSATEVPFAHEHTHDILPDSPSGVYYAAGLAVGSTLSPRALR